MTSYIFGDSFKTIAHQPYRCVVHTKLQMSWNDLHVLAEQLLGMHNVRTHHIVFELCMMEKKKEKRRVTYEVDLAIEYQRDVVCKCFSLLCFVIL